jgi:hypothetical protein
MTESTRRAELEAQGWTACFVADEPRLSEAVELYESLGLEVHLEPPRPDSDECTTYLENSLDLCRMIYTRRSSQR